MRNSEVKETNMLNQIEIKSDLPKSEINNRDETVVKNNTENKIQQKISRKERKCLTNELV